MKTYTVGIQIIEVWNIEVTAASEEAAKEKAWEMQVDAIRKQGDLQSIETDYAEVIA